MVNIAGKNVGESGEWTFVKAWKVVDGVVWDVNSLTKKNTISRWNTSVLYDPERWGHTTSCMIDGVELFHAEFADSEKPKGWMPFMFPNAGPLTDTQRVQSWIDLVQHGFWRLSKWKEIGEWEQELVFDRPEGFLYSWSVRNKIEITDSGDVIFHHFVTNTGDSPMPISSGLHPYFNIPGGDKSAVEWRFDDGDCVRDEREVWSNGGTGEYDMPKDGTLKFYIPEVWEITLEVSEDYKNFWVWSLGEKQWEKDFVCVEPVMNHPWGIVENPVMIDSGKTKHNWMKISLKK